MHQAHIYQPPTDIVLASNNHGKLAEFQQIFAQLSPNTQIHPQATFNIEDAEETGLSFIENAIIKARHAARQSGHVALADDSGLCVPLLQGAPGIYSARYAGIHGHDAANNQKLLDELSPLRQQHARIPAMFICILAMVRHAEDPLPIISQGVWHGEIATQPIGDGGFGYDPLFWIPKLNQSAAQLSKSEKSALSHRGKAMKHLIKQLKHDESN